MLDQKIKEVDLEVRPILENLALKISEANQQVSSSNLSGGNISSRSKLITPSINK